MTTQIEWVGEFTIPPVSMAPYIQGDVRLMSRFPQAVLPESHHLEYGEWESEDWEDPLLPRIRQQPRGINEQLEKIQMTMDTILSRLDDIQELLAEAVVSSATSITGIIAQGREHPLRTPLMVSLIHGDEEVMAGLPEFEAIGVGQSPSDAIVDLKEHLGELYLDLMSTSDGAMGVLPRRWKASLGMLVDTDA